MAFKTISLMESRWGAICATLEEFGNDQDKRNASMIREQLSGAVKVEVRGGRTIIKAGRPSVAASVDLAGPLNPNRVNTYWQPRSERR